MNGTAILGSIKRGFGGLFRFSGRDTRAQYWPYALFLIVVQLAVGMVMTLRMMWTAATQAFAAVGEARDGQPINPEAMDANMVQAMAGDMQMVMVVSIVVGSLFTLFMLAATARRLHDRGWSGWWMAIPVGAQLINIFTVQAWLAALPDLMARQAAGDIAALDSMAATTGWLRTLASIASWIIYIVLLIQLVQAGSGQPNRYGAAPDALPEGPSLS